MKKLVTKLKHLNLQIIIIAFVGIVLIVAPLISLFHPSVAAAAWFNEDWRYRKPISITHTVSENNVYATVTLDTSDTTKNKSNCTDLRFTDASGSTIPYHIVSGCGTTNTQVQLLFGNLPSGDQTFYVYYGNPNATDTKVVATFNNLASGVTTSLGAEENSQGPVAAWKFDEGYGTTTHNSMTSGNNGTMTNGPTWQGEDMCVSGKCLYFDGVDDYVTIPDNNSLDLTNGWTIGGWYKPTQTVLGGSDGSGTVRQVLVSKEFSSSGLLTNYEMEISALGRIKAYVADGTTTKTTIGSTILNPNTWYYLISTYNGSTGVVTIYINGHLEVSNATGIFSANANIGTVHLGNFDFNWTSYRDEFQGFMDSVKIYGYARSQQQIQQDYATGTTSLSQQQANLANNLVGYYKMDEASWNGTAGEISDSSGNGNNGVSVNGATIGSGKFSNGGKFDGIDDYASIGSPLGTSKSRTLSVWANPNAVAPSGRLGVLGENGGVRIDYGNGVGTTAFHALITFTDSSILEVSTSNTSINSWTYVSATVDATQGTFSIYINGQLVQQKTWDPSVKQVTNSTSQFIGRVNSTSYFSGSLDEARLYNRTLSTTEVSQLYNYAPKPVAYYDFEEGSGGSTFDKSSNGNIGTWHGTGTHYADGKYGKGGSLNGTNDFVTVGTTVLNAATTYSIELWVNIPTQTASFHRIMSDSTGSISIYCTADCTTGLFGRIGGSSDGWITNGGGATNITGGWKHIAITVDSTGLQSAYVNDVLVGTRSLTFTSTTVSSLFIGSSSAQSALLQGSLDDIHIYNYARTQSQILQDMQATTSDAKSPIGYWKFDEGQGTTAANSGIGGSSLNGTLTSMSLPATSTSGWATSGRYNRGLNFDGTDDRVVVPSSAGVNTTGNFTLSAWIKPAAVSGTLHTIAGKYDFGNNNRSYRIYIDTGGNLGAGVSADGSLTTSVSGSSVLSVNTWYYIALVYDGNKLHIYVNGKHDGSASYTSSIYAGSANFVIGANLNNGTQTNLFSGTIDGVKYYNGALTASDILVDFNQSSGFVAGNISTEPTIAASGATASKPSNSAGSAYCVPGDATACAAPVGEWKFEEGSGTSVKDTSGNGFTGTWNGGGANHWTPGKIGKAGNLNGSNDYVVVNDASNLDPTSFTLETWVKLNVIDGAYHTFVGKWKPGVNQQYLLQLDTDGKFAFWTGNGGSGGSRIASTTTPMTGKWYHLVGTQTGTTKNLYINGQLESTTTGATALGSSTIPFSMGSKQNGSGTYFEFLNGQIDTTTLYSYARTPAQVAWDYNNGKPVAEWKMDECQGAIAHDSSGNGLNGTISIGALGTQTSIGTCQASGKAWGNGVLGKYNNSISFDGTDDFVACTDLACGGTTRLDVAAGTEFSFGTWFNTNASGSRTLIGKKSTTSSSTAGYQALLSSNGYAVCRIGDGTTQVSPTGTSPLNDGKWHYIFCINTGSSLSLYVDGSRIARSSTASVVGSLDNAADFRLGENGDNSNSYTGQLDDMTFFNYALTDTQIKTLYNSGAVYYGP